MERETCHGEHSVQQQQRIGDAVATRNRWIQEWGEVNWGVEDWGASGWNQTRLHHTRDIQRGSFEDKQ
jgi:hypothetical protein